VIRSPRVTRVALPWNIAETVVSFTLLAPFRWHLGEFMTSRRVDLWARLVIKCNGVNQTCCSCCSSWHLKQIKCFEIPQIQ
jgi:hypothetical protein